MSLFKPRKTTFVKNKAQKGNSPFFYNYLFLLSPSLLLSLPISFTSFFSLFHLTPPKDLLIYNRLYTYYLFIKQGYFYTCHLVTWDKLRNLSVSLNL